MMIPWSGGGYSWTAGNVMTLWVAWAHRKSLWLMAPLLSWSVPYTAASEMEETAGGGISVFIPSKWLMLRSFSSFIMILKSPQTDSDSYSHPRDPRAVLHAVCVTMGSFGCCWVGKCS